MGAIPMAKGTFLPSSSEPSLNNNHFHFVDGSHGQPWLTGTWGSKIFNWTRCYPEKIRVLVVRKTIYWFKQLAVSTLPCSKDPGHTLFCSKELWHILLKHQIDKHTVQGLSMFQWENLVFFHPTYKVHFSKQSVSFS